MKKRILALALAGTTAFSVFGAAMSANAAPVYYGSSHVGAYDGAYYQSYKPAGDIRWSTKSTAAEKGNANVDFYGNAGLVNKDGVLTAGSTVYTLGNTTGFAGKGYTVKDLTKEAGYFATLADFMKAQGYQGYTLKNDGSFEITTNSGSSVTTTTYVIATENGYTGTNTQYVIFPKDGVKTGYTQVSSTSGWEVYVTSFNEGAKVYVPSTTGSNFNNDVAGLLNSYANRNGMYYIADKAAGGIVEATNLTKYASNTQVYTTVASTDQGVYTDAGYTTLDSVDVTDIDAVLNETVYPNGVVYLYDYYYDTSYPVTVSADAFAEGWAKGTLATLLDNNTVDKDGIGVINPETAYSYRSIRSEVIYAWQDFLDELGIADASNAGLTRWAKETLKNYAYTYYDASIIADANFVNGQWVITYGKKVNLYNFDDLIEDILEYAPSNKVVGAQTSELIYLMQQYNKYVDGGFVTENPVETDDWGDLLVSLIEAPTAEDFKTEAAYKRYTNAGEDLIEQYNEAETSVAVSMAEEEMYKFVTKYNSAYTTANTKLDKTALTTAIDNTYFNANWTLVGEVYAAQDKDGVLNGASANVVANKDYTTAWALYPVDDYSGSASGSYPGVDTAIKNVSSEYFWFYNVYDLAYNVYNNSKYQSVVDAMATALDEAVEALVPTNTPYASTILKAEEQNEKLADLVETDYVAAMWANRNKINSYINDRVSNEEIGTYGSSNAADIAKETAARLGWQKNQTVVTKSDITSVKTAKASAEAALTALRNDQGNYNAAQANALNKAIDSCDYILDLYNGVYGKTASVQSVNTAYNTQVGDKDQILKSMITAAVEEVDAAINFSNVIQGWSKNEAGKWQYGTEKGYLANGWNQVDGGKTWFYFNEDGTAKQSEWWNDNGTWYWFNSNCGAATGWAKVDGSWYYFKGNNAMKTGWEKVDGNWYYMASSGKMVTGWCEIGGKWYYFSKESNSLGQMLYNTTVDGYKLDANGVWVK